MGGKKNEGRKEAAEYGGHIAASRTHCTGRCGLRAAVVPDGDCRQRWRVKWHVLCRTEQS
jgi:hypothetical protein